MSCHIRLELRVSVNSSTDRKSSGTCNIKLLTLLVSCIVLVNVHLSVLVPNPHKRYEGMKGIQLKIELNRAIKSAFELYMDQFFKKM